MSLDWTDWNPEAQPERRGAVVPDMEALQQQAEAVLDRHAITAGALYVRLQRLEAALRHSMKVTPPDETARVARDLRIALNDVDAALTLLRGVK